MATKMSKVWLLHCVSKNVSRHQRLFPVLSTNRAMSSSGSDGKTKDQKTVPPQKPPNEPPDADSHAKAKKILRKVGVPVAVGIVGVALAPVAITALGFTAGGIAAGSVGAGMMSTAATTGVGMGAVSFLQSAGAAGLTVAANAGIFAGSSAAAAAVDAVSKENGRNPTDQGESTKKAKTSDVGTNTANDKADRDTKEEADASDKKDNSV